MCHPLDEGKCHTPANRRATQRAFSGSKCRQNLRTWVPTVAIIEKRGRDVVVLGPGGEKRFKHKDEAGARDLMNRINFIRKNNEKDGGSDHLRERPIEVK